MFRNHALVACLGLLTTGMPLLAHAQGLAVVPCEAQVEDAQDQIKRLKAEISELRSKLAALDPSASFVSLEGFRQAKWGMSMKEVQALFPKAQKSKGGSFLVLQNQTVAGHEGYFQLQFTHNRFDFVAIVLTEKFVNDMKYVERFWELKELLGKKYGEPTKDKRYRTDDLFTDTNQLGMAVKTGGLAFVTEWQSEKTEIELSLTGENYKTETKLIYMSRELDAARRAARESKKLDDL